MPRRTTPPPKPTREDLADAVNRTVPDVIAPNLDVLFCGINPGLWSGATGHHFARPGNRFWPALHQSGFTPRQLAPWEEHELVDLGCGITNLVMRTTAKAEELDAEELRKGRERLLRKVRRCQPRFVAMLGIGAFRTAFGRPRAQVGRQDEPFGGATLWLLPQPSGLNANHQLPELVRLFGELRAAALAGRSPGKP